MFDRQTVRAPGLWRPAFLVTAVVIAAVDLWSKAWAWDYVDTHGIGLGHKTVTVVDPWFKLVKAENTGTVWGLFRGFTGILIGLRCAMVLGLLALAWFTSPAQRLKLFGCGLVLGGAAGNLYDNLSRDSGGVRDFLDFWIPLPWREELWHYPTFNVADASILSGAVLLWIAFSRETPKEKAPAERARAEAAEES